MLELKNVTKYYDDVLGCRNISFKLNKGEIFGFIGPNGAGKSTTIRCIMNMINKTSGEVYIDGNCIDFKNFKIKEKIGYLPSEIHLYEDLTIKEHLEYNASFYQKDCMKKALKLAKKLELDLKKKVDELSLGTGKKLGIILALMHEPDLIIMDEATSGLDPLMQEKFYEILEDERENGKTILFSSHNLSEVKRLCETVAIIKDGSIITIDETKKLANSNFTTITLVSNELNKFIKKIKGKIIEKSDNEVRIIFDDKIDNFVKIISNYSIDKLLIEEPSIEEIFMHYYV